MQNWSRWQTNTAFQAIYVVLEIMLTNLKRLVLLLLVITLSLSTFAFFSKCCLNWRLNTTVSINTVVESGSVLIFLATTAYIPNLANGCYFRHSQRWTQKGRRLFPSYHILSLEATYPLCMKIEWASYATYNNLTSKLLTFLYLWISCRTIISTQNVTTRQKEKHEKQENV